MSNYVGSQWAMLQRNQVDQTDRVTLLGANNNLEQYFVLLTRGNNSKRMNMARGAPSPSALGVPPVPCSLARL